MRGGMPQNTYSRKIIFESIFNFRDLGGYRAKDGKTIAWRRLFRSADLRNISSSDFNKLQNELGLASIIDLRSRLELERQGRGILTESGIKYNNISFMTDEGTKTPNEQLQRAYKNMGEFYLHQIQQKVFGQRIVEALKIIAEPENLPLIFHCAVGKDRTGMLAAILLSILGVADADIIDDYAASAPYMDDLLIRIKNGPLPPGTPPDLPDYFWTATPESMAFFLSTIKREYGSAKGYIEVQGAEKSLFDRLEMVLLT
jgi:protein-tyrosine phosphatase